MEKKKKVAKFDYKTIKTFEDACKKENIDPTKLPDVSMIPEEFHKPIVAAYKLYVIFKAINNGWTPYWNDSSEYKYYPWFWVNASKEKPSGFGFSSSDCDFTTTGTGVGSRLCVQTSEEALYIAGQFTAEYLDFLLIIK